MTYDINSYEIFLHGEYNPMADSPFDEEAMKAEKRFYDQLENYVESYIVFIKIDYFKIIEDHDYILNLLQKFNFIELGFQENDKISIEIDPDEIDENDKIEICIKSESKGECPTLESKKLAFYDEIRNKIKEGIKRDIKQITLNFHTEERVKVFINQQYQFALNYLNEFYRRRRLVEEMGKPMDKKRKVKRPNETNSTIITFLISDLLNILNFIENNYKTYLNKEVLNQETKEKSLTAKSKVVKYPKNKSKWTKLFDIQLLELKPNFMGLGLNLNELLTRIKRK